MPIKTNTGLVEHVRMALAQKWPYVWGTFGGILTENVFRDKLAQYPEGVGNFKDFISKNSLNKRTADCVGLIKSYIWWDGTGPKYDRNTDVSADGMYNMATEKGPIGTMPDIPGICVRKPGHIGVYVGGGRVIEEHGTLYGIKDTPLTGPGSTGWTHWLKCPFIEYISPKKPMTVDNAIALLVEKKKLSNPDGWRKALAAIDGIKCNLGDIDVIKNLKYLFIKWAEDVQ